MSKETKKQILKNVKPPVFDAPPKTSPLLWTKKDYREYKTKTATVCFYNFTNFLIEKNAKKQKT